MEAEEGTARTKVTAENVADVLAFLRTRRPMGVDRFLPEITTTQLLAAGEVEEDEEEGIGYWKLYISGELVCSLVATDEGADPAPVDPRTAS